MNKPPRPCRNCPHADCESHAPGGRSRVIRHSRLKTKQGLRRRLLCKVCGRTFVHTLGTPYYRMRKPHRLFDQAAALQVEGLPQASIARALGSSPGTISRWLEKASQRVREFEAEHLHVDDPVEIQIDELKAFGAGDRDRTWLFSGIEVWSRLWLASEVGPRTLRCTRIFVRALRNACTPGFVPPLVTSDEFKYYEQVLRRVFGYELVHVQVHNRYRRDRIIRSTSRLVSGQEWKLEYAEARSEDSKRHNTSYIERLNLYIRFACSYLRRRTPAPMKKPQKLTDAIALLRTFYNFIRPHSSLKFGRVKRTPAMQAEIFPRALTFREVFSWVPPPRPSYVQLQAWGRSR